MLIICSSLLKIEHNYNRIAAMAFEPKIGAMAFNPMYKPGYSFDEETKKDGWNNAYDL